MNKGMPIDEVAALSSTKEGALPRGEHRLSPANTEEHRMKKNADKPAVRRVRKSKSVDLETILRALYEVGIDESEKAINSGFENPPAMTRAKVDAKIRKLLRKKDKS
jgi:hypothetical protein